MKMLWWWSSEKNIIIILFVVAAGTQSSEREHEPSHFVPDFPSPILLSCSAGGSTFISEPYYREYFAGGDGSGQGYAPSRSIYGDTAEGPSQSAYEGRYANHIKSAAVYTKTVTAAGLTVDLPSPDSGIGADAITPRDQNNIQQVNDVSEWTTGK